MSHATDDDGASARAADFLDAARLQPGENRFALGTFERGITLYRQQVRALNLVHALVTARRDGRPAVTPRCRVVIIGGGAFGMTAAAAAAYAEFDVRLLERHEVPMHLQRGCDTRWIHPHSYDWPSAGSGSELAQLPLLDWRAAKAAEVASMVSAQFDDVMARPGLKLETVYGTKQTVVTRNPDGTFQVAYLARDQQGYRQAEIVIVAVGFGVEEASTVPYWRNDDLAQSAVGYVQGVQVEYVVWGLGDGALVDVFRLTIQDFRQDLVLEQMFGQGPDATALRERLAALREASATSRLQPGGVYDSLQELQDEAGPAGDALRSGMSHLQGRIRSDTRTLLVSRQPDLRSGLSLDRMSLGNALLAYCLFQQATVRYRFSPAGTYARVRAELRGERLIGPKAKFIVRHGTARGKALRDVGLSDAEVALMEGRRAEDTARQLYPAGWWGRYTMPGQVGASGEPARVEHVPPALQVHATTFVSTLASIIGVPPDGTAEGAAESGAAEATAWLPKFRITLHRLVRFDDQTWFQQVTDYYGRGTEPGGAGRIFPVMGGMVGLTCKAGSSTLVRRSDEAKFAEVWTRTNLYDSGAKAIRNDVRSLLTWPFVVPGTPNGNRWVVMVLFMDSDDLDFFDTRRLGMVEAAAAGFARLIDALLGSRAIEQRGGVQPGFELPPQEENATLVDELAALGVVFGDRQTGQTLFEALSGTDLEFGNGLSVTPYRPMAAPPPNEADT